jgi:hypothetical protein
VLNHIIRGNHLKILVIRGMPFKDANTGAVCVKVISAPWIQMIFLSQRTPAQSGSIMPKEKEK